MKAPRKSDGFSLIELMIAIAIVAILLTTGIPAFTTLIQNSKLRNAAENCLAGLQRARSEALQKNDSIEFLLTNDNPIAANVAAFTPSATGRNWAIRHADMSAFIEGHAGIEGSGQSASSNVAVDGNGVSSIVFNGLGRANLAATATFNFTNPAGGSCAPAGPMRCLNVLVSVGGQIRLCDPAATAAGDTRGC